MLEGTQREPPARFDVSALDDATREQLAMALLADGVRSHLEGDDLVVLAEHEWAVRSHLADLDPDATGEVRRTTVVDVARLLPIEPPELPTGRIAWRWLRAGWRSIRRHWTR